MNHKPEDLPDELTIVPSRAGEQARMKKRVQSSRSLSGLGDFFYLESRSRWILICVALAVAIVTGGSVVWACSEEGCADMKRRQQGILTGMPFMAHVSSRSFVDDAGRKMYLAKTPARIVSLAPSVTEMLFAIGAGEQLVGVTDYCDYPPEATQKAKIGYANPNIETLVALQPDLIVAPQEYLKPDLIGKLEQLKIPVFILADRMVEDVFSHIQTFGRMLDRSTEATALGMDLRQQIARIKTRTQGAAPVRVLYVLNSEPLITVGPGSYIDQLIGLAGGINVAARSATAYPRFSMEVVLQENPDILLFPVGTAEGISESEQQAWRKWSTLTAVKRNNLRQIPADLLNRPGPRIGKALELLADLFHPSATSLPSESH